MNGLSIYVGCLKHIYLVRALVNPLGKASQHFAFINGGFSDMCHWLLLTKMLELWPETVLGKENYCNKEERANLPI